MSVGIKKGLWVQRVLIVLAIGGLVGGFAVGVGTWQDESEFDEEMYHDVIVTLLTPAIDEEIGSFYSKTFMETPGFAPYQTKIISMRRPIGYRTALFRIEVEILPYFGPHLYVGRDRVVIEIDASHDPNVLKYIHMEEYPLPEHYWELYR